MKKGSVLFSTIVIMTGLLFIGIAVSSAILSTSIKTNSSYKNISASYIAEAGINKTIFELNNGNANYASSTVYESFGGGEYGVSAADCPSTFNCKYITSTGYIPNHNNYKYKRKIRVKIGDAPSTTSVAFNYGIQTGSLGITMSPNSKITGANGNVGNVYSQGSITGANNAVVTGDVIIAGPTGKIDSMQVNGNAKAHNIVNSVVGKDAYYQTIDTKTTVSGSKCLNANCHPNSTDPPSIGLPITQDLVTQWEGLAVAGGTYNGSLNLVNDPAKGYVTIGPKVITGDLTADTGTIVVVRGTVWVQGNINLANNMTIVLDPGYGGNNAIIIADNPSNQGSYGKVFTGNGVKICGSISVSDCQNNVAHPENNSSILFLSTNTGSTVSNPAITASNNTKSVIYYTINGLLNVNNNANLKSFTGAGIYLSNGAQVSYDQGLAGGQFAWGPGGKWVIKEWQALYN